MKNLLALLFFVVSTPINRANAQSSIESSGIYQNLILGVDAKQSLVTGYYKEVYEPPNAAHLECSFYFFGKKEGNHYSIQTGTPGDKKYKAMVGQLSFYSQENAKPSVLMKLEESPSRDCSALKPALAKEPGVYFDIQKSGTWSEVRMVARSKSPYYQAPDPAAPTRNSAKRGTVLTVADRRSGWAQVQADQKPKGWMREEDLFPIDPNAAPENPEPVVAIFSPKSDTAPGKTDAPAPKPLEKPQTKEGLIDRLQAINAQCFEMALQVVKNPAKRKSLASQRGATEKELDSLVSQLNLMAPSAYPETSKEIIEAFLDLQYVRQECPVTSLRLHKVIQNFGK